MTSTSRAKNISLVQWFLIGWRTRLPPRLRRFRVGSGRIGLRLPMHCSNRRSYSLISLQVAPAQMVPALSGIRPVAYPSTSVPPGPVGFRWEGAFIGANPWRYPLILVSECVNQEEPAGERGRHIPGLATK